MFNSNLYALYINEKGEKYPKNGVVADVKLKNRNQPHIVHPKMKKVVGEYFKCENNNGLPITSNDKAHFVQQLLSDSAMRPKADAFQDRYSIINKTLYEISGWYVVSPEAKTEETLWGKNKGCRFLNLECTDDKGKMFDEYCDLQDAKNKIGCDYYYRSPAACNFYSDLVDDTCAIMAPSDTVCDLPDTKDPNTTFPFQNYSENSKCLEFFDTQDKRFAGCFEAHCNKETRSISIVINGKTEECAYNKEGKPLIENFKANVGGQFGELKFNFPASYDRFCFYIEHKQDPEKGFKKK